MKKKTTSDAQNIAILPVWIAFGVEWTHVADLLEVDIGEDELVITGVDDSRSIRARKHI